MGNRKHATEEQNMEELYRELGIEDARKRESFRSLRQLRLRNRSADDFDIVLSNNAYPPTAYER